MTFLERDERSLMRSRSYGCKAAQTNHSNDPIFDGNSAEIGARTVGISHVSLDADVRPLNHPQGQLFHVATLGCPPTPASKRVHAGVRLYG